MTVRRWPERVVDEDQLDPGDLANLRLLQGQVWAGLVLMCKTDAPVPTKVDPEVDGKNFTGRFVIERPSGHYLVSVQKLELQPRGPA